MPQVDPDYRLIVGPAGLQKWIHKDHVGELTGPWQVASGKQEHDARVDLESNIFEEGMAVADVAMMGIPSSLAIAAHEAIGNEDHAESVRQVAQRGREAIGPTGEVAGLALGLVGSLPLKGTGILAKTLKGIGAPMRGVTRAGQLVEKGVRVGARKAGLRGVTLRRGLPEVARGGVEGMAYGGIHGITDSVIYDKELTAEQLAIHAGLGAGVGAGATVGLKMLGALKRPGRKAWDRVAQKASGNEKAGGGLLARSFGEGSGLVSSAEKGDITGMVAATKAAKRTRELAVFKADDVLDTTSRGVTKNLREVESAAKTLKVPVTRPRYGGKGGRKEEEFSKIIHREKHPGSQWATLEREAYAVENKVKDLLRRENKSLFKTNDEITQLGERTFWYSQRLQMLSAGKRDIAKGYILIDQLKAEVGQMADAMGKRAWKGTRYKNTRDEFETLYMQMRTTLEDERLWGAAAAAQKRINAPWTTMIQEEQIYNNKLSTRVPADKSKDPFGPDEYLISGERVDGFVKGVTSPGKDDTYLTIRRNIENKKAWAEAVEENVHLTATEKKAAETLRKNADEALDTLSKAEEAMTARNTLRGIEHAQRRGLGALMMGATGVGAYGLIEGDPGLAGAGLLAAALMRPGMAIRGIAAVEKAAGDIGVKSGGKLANFFKKAKPAGERAVRIGAIEAERRQRTDFQETRKKLRDRSPEQVANTVKNELGVVSSVSPETMALAGDVAQMAHAYALENLPSDTSPYLLAPSVPPSKGEIDQFMKKMRILEDPTKLLDDLLDGKASGSDVETVRDVFPAIYRQIREEALGKVADMAMRGKELPYHDRLQLDMLLDLKIEPTLDPELFKTLQGLYAMPPTPPQQPPKQTANAPDLASAWRTDVQQQEAASEEGYQ